MQSVTFSEIVLIVASAMFAFFVSQGKYRVRTKIGAMISLSVSLAMILFSQWLWANTGKGLLEQITCVFCPSCSPCHDSLPAPPLTEAVKNPTHTAQPSTNVSELTLPAINAENQKVPTRPSALPSSVVPALVSLCVEPIAPASVNGATATEQELKDAITNFQAFQLASDDYQNCMIAESKAPQEAAKAEYRKPLNPGVVQAVSARIDANQRLKERVGGELNAAILQYRMKHQQD